ncbi:hypothetical protein YC2023_112086 [Brassica napus]
MKRTMPFIISGMMKLTIGITTCLLLLCLVILQESSNIFNLHNRTCLSRYQSYLYRKTSPYKPSQHLISKLRRYEMLHKRCGPGTEAYKSATEKLGHNHVSNSGDECRYVLCVSPLSGLGLGNRMISMLDSFNREYSRCINSTTVPSQLYLYLFHDYGDHDQMFFCEDNQMIIGKVPWLVAKSNQYFVPSLWLIPSFQTKLIKLFPEKDTVFHHLSRYLLHPINQVWGMVTRSYIAYLSRADERLGIQVRVFEKITSPPPIKHVMDQIVACTQREKLLPEVDTHEKVTTTEKPSKLKAVLVTSLTSGYSESLKSMYWEHPTSTGDVVVVHQPSQEAYQQSDKKLHNKKTLAEMFLLSMTDEVVISASSTFGYVAQGMGGLKSWILYEPVNHTVPDPPCGRAISMEPCFHVPPVYGCNGKTGTNTGNIVPFVRHCEDRILGIKLVQDTS